MRGRTADANGDVFDSISLLNKSNSEFLQGVGSALSWPEEPLGFSLYGRWIPDMPPHGEWYANLSYQATDWLRVGFNYRPRTNDVSLLANLRVFPENDRWRPALILGTNNNDFGDINSTSYYATVSKFLFEAGGVNVSLYGGGTFIEELDELRPVGGIHLRKDAWSGIFMHSGVDEHVSISRDFGNHTVTFLLFDLDLPGIAYGFRF